MNKGNKIYSGKTSLFINLQSEILLVVKYPYLTITIKFEAKQLGWELSKEAPIFNSRTTKKLFNSNPKIMKISKEHFFFYMSVPLEDKRIKTLVKIKRSFKPKWDLLRRHGQVVCPGTHRYVNRNRHFELPISSESLCLPQFLDRFFDFHLCVWLQVSHNYRLLCRRTPSLQ